MQLGLADVVKVFEPLIWTCAPRLRRECFEHAPDGSLHVLLAAFPAQLSRELLPVRVPLHEVAIPFELEDLDAPSELGTEAFEGPIIP